MGRPVRPPAATIRALADIKLTWSALISAGARLIHATERVSVGLFPASNIAKTDDEEALLTLRE